MKYYVPVNSPDFKDFTRSQQKISRYDDLAQDFLIKKLISFLKN